MNRDQLASERLSALSAVHGLRSVVFTFDRPTRLTLTGDTEYKQIYTKKERREILEKRGIDILIEHPFTKEFAALNADGAIVLPFSSIKLSINFSTDVRLLS